jgi:hypothetical protein
VDLEPDPVSERVAEVLAVPRRGDDVARDPVGVLAREPRADALHRGELCLEADRVRLEPL